MQEFKSEIFNGSEFTNQKVMGILEGAYKSKKRLRLFQGKDNKVWNEEFDIIGTVGRSTGESKVALLIYNSRSMGGGTILTDCIIGIYDVENKRKLYWDDDYIMPIAEVKQSDLKEYESSLFLDGILYARGTYKQMIRLSQFMTAKRFSK
ncbi:MAG: hypothetical protein QG567_2483 [Campylobacterota bacterium]|nr:hypothetical protein [Campylobacterota bacterium]